MSPYIFKIEKEVLKECIDKDVVEVKIPEHVHIAPYAFKGCNKLKKITFVNYSDGYDKIDSHIFSGCPNLNQIVFKPRSLDCRFKDGWLIDNAGYTLFGPAERGRLLRVFGKAGKVVIPDEVREISADVFESCKDEITEVVIPDTVEEILYNAFRDCTALRSIMIADSVQISGCAFSGCINLKEIKSYGNNQAFSKYAIKDGAFLELSEMRLLGMIDLTGDVTIPEGVKIIARAAFSDCPDLTSVEFPKSLVKIEDDAFINCPNLCEKTQNTKSQLRGGTCMKYADMTEVDIPNTAKAIESNTFYHCTDLVKINIPNSVTVIKSKAFAGCTNLSQINIPDSVLAIEYSAFEGCTSLKEVSIPKSCAKIGMGAFGGCTSLSKIDIPESVVTIEFSAFNGCI